MGVSRFEDESLVGLVGWIGGERRVDAGACCLMVWIGRIKVIRGACMSVLPKEVTGLVLGGGPAMLTRIRVGWVLAAGGRRVRCCNYNQVKEWRGV